jgi:hypothetical protein
MKKRTEVPPSRFPVFSSPVKRDFMCDLDYRTDPSLAQLGNSLEEK